MSDPDQNQFTDVARVAATAAGALLSGVPRLALAVSDPELERVQESLADPFRGRWGRSAARALITRLRERPWQSGGGAFMVAEAAAHAAAAHRGPTRGSPSVR